VIDLFLSEFGDAFSQCGRSEEAKLKYQTIDQGEHRLDNAAAFSFQEHAKDADGGQPKLMCCGSGLSLVNQ